FVILSTKSSISAYSLLFLNKIIKNTFGMIQHTNPRTSKVHNSNLKLIGLQIRYVNVHPANTLTQQLANCFKYPENCAFLNITVNKFFNNHGSPTHVIVRTVLIST